MLGVGRAAEAMGEGISRSSLYVGRWSLFGLKLDTSARSEFDTGGTCGRALPDLDWGRFGGPVVGGVGSARRLLAGLGSGRRGGDGTGRSSATDPAGRYVV
jgi:hypothetical protein